MRIIRALVCLFLFTPWDSFSQIPACGQACGECDAGTVQCVRCEPRVCAYPSSGQDSVIPAAADTGARTVFDPDAFGGTDAAKISAAGAAAEPGDDAVVMDRVYVIDNEVTIYEGVMYTGGVLRRKCNDAPTATASADSGDSCVDVDDTSDVGVGINYLVTTNFAFNGTLGEFLVDSTPSATRMCVAGTIGFNIPIGARLTRAFHLMKMEANPTDNIIIDSVRFDGNRDCGTFTKDWRYSNTVPLRGANTVRNSIFHDTPSENLTVCGSTISDNIAFDLGGSFLHKSCGSDPEALDTVSGNYVENANINTDADMQHSEGLITFSSNAGNWDFDDNVFRFGAEGVFGRASSDEEDGGVTSDNDCYAHFSARLVALTGVDLSNFVWTSNEMIDIKTNTRIE